MFRMWEDKNYTKSKIVQMKKYIILLTLLLFLFQINAQNWKPHILKNKWGDIAGTCYLQFQQGTDGKNSYTVNNAFGISDKGFKFFVTTTVDSLKIHPGYYDSTVQVSFRYNGKIIKKESAVDKVDDIGFISASIEDGGEIYSLLKQHGSLDILIEGKNWYVRTKVEGIPDIDLSSEKVLQFSDNGKTVAVKKGYASFVETVRIPNGVTTIKESAFENCENLRQVTIPNSVTTIEEKAFFLCQNLKEIVIPNAVRKIGKLAFSWTAIEAVTIPDGVATIEEYTFQGCVSLKKVVIPNSVTTIKMGAFLRCDSLETVTVPDSVKEIGDSAFGGCESLKTISIPNNVVIQPQAFSGCRSLQEIKSTACSIKGNFVIVDNTLNSILNYKEENWAIPKGVTAISDYLFSHSEFTTITIPKDIALIGDHAFWNCPNLESVVIEKGSKLASLDFSKVFSECENLKTITLPKSVKLSHVPTSVRIIRN